MLYTSTRNNKLSVTFTEIIKKGVPEDGGLFIPKKFPKIKCNKKTFKETICEVFKAFTTKKEYKHFKIKKICDDNYKIDNFPLGKIKLKRVYKNFNILEISNGSSFSFKDIAISFISKIFKIFFKKEKVLCATSGDTGSSCINFFKKSCIKTFVFSPLNRTSKFQAYQMYSVIEKNIFNIAIDDNFDACQSFLKEFLKSEEKFNTVNSINWLRILIQTSYYIYCYNLKKKKKINLIIPTGNFGNAYSAYLARKIFCKNIENIFVVTNENDVLFNFFKYGIYDEKRLTIKTNSPSMDISKASNLERIIFEIYKNKVSSIYKNKVFKIKKNKISRYKIKSFRIKEKERKKIISKIYKKKNIVLDPHTSNGFCLIKKNINKIPCIVTETAKPIKFYEYLKKILNKKKNFKDKLKPNYKVLKMLYLKKTKFFKFKSKDKKKIRNFIKINS